jgi:hypothetical protein
MFEWDHGGGDKPQDLSSRAAAVKAEIDDFLKKNSFKSGSLSLSLGYYQLALSPFTYFLTTKSGVGLSFSIKEMNDLKDFLNSIELIK